MDRSDFLSFYKQGEQVVNRILFCQVLPTTTPGAGDRRPFGLYPDRGGV